MRSAILITLLSLQTTSFVNHPAAAQQENPQSAALQRVTYDIKYLASDELGGRKPGTEGIELAAQYIEEQYKQAGLQTLDNGTYRQEFKVRQGLALNENETSLKFVGSEGDEATIEFKLNEDYIPQAKRSGFDFDTDLVFAGYGINAEKELNYNDYRDVDVKGKVVLLIRREPQQEREDSVFDGTEVSRFSYIATKVAAAKRAGAIGIIMVNDGLSADNDEKDTLESPTRFRTTFPMIHVKRKAINDFLAQAPLIDSDGRRITNLAEVEQRIDETLSPMSQPFAGWKVVASSEAETKMAPTSNIIGIIEGEGPLADETIVIGGHYDHLGMGGMGSRVNRREIHNGADDNATGTAAVIELARRFAQRPDKPARRLVFVCFSAEEMGLLGAYHYVKEPIVSLDRTNVMVNFDMIGWLRDDKVTVFNATSAAEFDSLLDRANEGLGMDVAKSSGFGGSDHLPFFQNNIPVMFIHTGLTSTYHTPEDDFETIDCAGAVRVIDYSEKIIDELLALENKPKFQGTGARRTRRVRLGVSLDDEVENGVRISRVLEGSIAEKAGFEEGDIITAVGVEKTDKRREVNRQIRANSGKTVMIKIRRGEEQLEKMVELKNDDEDSEDAG